MLLCCHLLLIHRQIPLMQISSWNRYAVFGLGSSMYPEFCAFAHAVDQKLAQLGASSVTLTGEGDELNGQEEAFRVWAVNTFKVTTATNLIHADVGLEGPRTNDLESWDTVCAPERICVTLPSLIGRWREVFITNFKNPPFCSYGMKNGVKKVVKETNR